MIPSVSIFISNRYLPSISNKWIYVVPIFEESLFNKKISSYAAVKSNSLAVLRQLL